MDVTLYLYNNEPSKNKHFPILLSSLLFTGTQIEKIEVVKKFASKLILLNEKNGKIRVTFDSQFSLKHPRHFMPQALLQFLKTFTQLNRPKKIHRAGYWP